MDAMRGSALTGLMLVSLLAGCSSSDDSHLDDSHLADTWEVSLGAPPASAACFRPGQALPLIVVVRDRNGNELPNTAIALSGDATGLLQSNASGGWSVVDEGARDLLVEYTGKTGSSASIAPVALRLQSDATPPQITVASPLRGAMLVTNNDVQVQGEVSDATSALASITVNGEEQPTSADAQLWNINVAPPGQWGLNTVTVVASDDCGNTARQVQSYLRSEQYLEPATVDNPPSRVPNGHGLKLAQETIDDSDRGDFDDLATLVERFLELNLNAALQPETGSAILFSTGGAVCDWIMRVTTNAAGVTVASPSVTGIDLITNGLRHRLNFSSIHIPLVVRQRIYNPFNCNFSEVRFVASITFDMAVTATTTSTVANGTVTMSSGSPSVTISNVALSVTGNTTVDSLLSSLLDSIIGFASDDIEGLLVNALPELDEALLNPLLAQTLTLSGGGYGFDVNLVSRIDNQSITTAALTQTAFTQVFPSTAAPPGEDEGPILRPIASPGFDATTEPLTYAISDNTINSGLWAAWYGGTFVFDDAVGLPGVRMSFIPMLPPVLMPGSADDESVLGVGDLFVALELDLAPGTIPGVEGAVSVEGYVSQYLRGTLGYSDARRQQLRLDVDPDAAETVIEFITAAIDGAPIKDAVVSAAILDYADRLIEAATQMLLNDSLAAVSVPPLRIDFADALGGGTVTAMELTLQQIRDVPDGILIDFRVDAEGQQPARDSDWLSMNHRWSPSDLVQQGVPNHVSVDYPESDPVENEADHSYRTTVAEYRNNLDDCNAAGEYEGKKRCLPTWKEPLDYGWYCGAGRPLDGVDAGWLSNPKLDPVDFCCRLHDRNLFDQKLGAASPLNACGFAMCLHKARASAPDIFDLMPNVERARVNMYNRAALLCAGGTLAPVGDPEIGQEPQ
jgi:hypothetical protein